MKKNTFIDGTIIASVAIIFVKILGALYVIPFYNIIGEEGGTLYSYAYSIYNLFLTNLMKPIHNVQVSYHNSFFSLFT